MTQNLGGRPEIGAPINVRLGDELLARLDRYAAETGISRADALRRIVDSKLSDLGVKPYNGMKISALITALQAAQAEYGDAEVKLDIDGTNCDPDIRWYPHKQLLYLW